MTKAECTKALKVSYKRAFVPFSSDTGCPYDNEGLLIKVTSASEFGSESYTLQVYRSRRDPQLVGYWAVNENLSNGRMTPGAWR